MVISVLARVYPASSPVTTETDSSWGERKQKRKNEMKLIHVNKAAKKGLFITYTRLFDKLKLLYVYIELCVITSSH